MLLANKLLKNIPDPRNPEEHYQSKLVKQLEIITCQTKIFDIVDIKSYITEHPKTSHKLSKTIRKGEKVDSSGSLYSDTKNVKIF